MILVELSGPCAKQVVKCTIISPDGELFIGENFCKTPQEVCPRLDGEGYEKCISICNQVGHAEIEALKLAGDKARGGTAIIHGHTYSCRSCQEALFAAGIEALSITEEMPNGEA